MYTQDDVRRVQNRLLQMAVAVRDILERHNIPHFIAYGTLLGAVRHRGFIPWDDDFDYYLFDDSYQQAMDVLAAELPADLFLENEKSEPLYFHGWAHVKDLKSVTECDLYPQDGCYSHHGISLDLYRMKEMPSSQVDAYRRREYMDYLDRRKALHLIDEADYERRTAQLRQTEAGMTADRQTSMRPVFATTLPGLEQIDRDEVFPLRKMAFEGTTFFAPRNPDTFLTLRYGSDYMQLPPVEQRVPHYSRVQFL